MPLVRGGPGRTAVSWKADGVSSTIIVVAGRPTWGARAFEVGLLGTEHLEVGVQDVGRAASLLRPPAACHQLERRELSTLFFPRGDTGGVALSVAARLVEVAIRTMLAAVNAVELTAGLILYCRVVYVAARPGRLHGGFVHAFGLSDWGGGGLLVPAPSNTIVQ